MVRRSRKPRRRRASIKGSRQHSIRRKFATELKDMVLKGLAYLGGWKGTDTLPLCYQQPDEEVMLEGLANRHTFGKPVVSNRALSVDTIADCTG